MIDPDFYLDFQEMDDDFACEDDFQQAEMCEDGCYYDTFDRIIDSNTEDPDCDIDQEFFSRDHDIDDFDEAFDIAVSKLRPAPDMIEPDGKIDPTTMGMAFALADEIKDAESGRYSVNEDTDRKNWEQVNRMTSLRSRHETNQRLRPFEQYIDDICRGRRSLFNRR